MNLIPLWLLVTARVVSNPLANVYQKLLTNRGAHPLFVIWASHGLLTLVCTPLLLIFGSNASLQFWADMPLCAVLAVASNVTLVEALRRADLSILGPLNAYKSVVSLLPGIIFLREFPDFWSLAGIALIIVGSYGLSDGSAETSALKSFWAFFAQRGIQLRIAALILSALEAVFLKRALLVASPEQVFLWWCALGFVVASLFLSLPGLRSNASQQLTSFRANLWRFLALAVFTGIMQLTTLLVFKQLHVASALAVFQTSVLISVFFGHAIFKEKHVLKRLLGAAIMLGGACLIILTGRN